MLPLIGLPSLLILPRSRLLGIMLWILYLHMSLLSLVLLSGVPGLIQPLKLCMHPFHFISFSAFTVI